MADEQNILRFYLKRKHSGRSWGFSMEGGYDNGLPIYIYKCRPEGIAYKAGLRVGDAVCMINNFDLTKSRLDDAKMAITRSANDFEIVIQRGLIDMSNQIFKKQESRSEIDESQPEILTGREGTKVDHDAPVVQSYSFRMLQKMVHDSETGEQPMEICQKTDSKVATGRISREDSLKGSGVSDL